MQLQKLIQSSRNCKVRKLNSVSNRQMEIKPNLHLSNKSIEGGSQPCILAAQPIWDLKLQYAVIHCGHAHIFIFYFHFATRFLSAFFCISTNSLPMTNVNMGWLSRLCSPLSLNFCNLYISQLIIRGCPSPTCHSAPKGLNPQVFELFTGSLFSSEHTVDGFD